MSLLKIIGPCHTVSSFLNTASVIMNRMEQALGKIILVFTYGSGCAASMYQMRVGPPRVGLESGCPGG